MPRVVTQSPLCRIGGTTSWDAACDVVQLWSGDESRGGDGVLLAAIGVLGRAGRSAHVVVGRATGARPGGAGRCATRGRVQFRRRGGRRARNSDGRLLEGVRLAGRAHAGRRPDVAIGVLRGRHGDRRRRKGAAGLRILRRAAVAWGADRPGAWRPIRGTPTTTSGGRTSTPAAPRSPCSGRWRRAISSSRRARVVA